MTNDQAKLILGFAEEGKEGDEVKEIDPKEVMQKFDTLIEKN